MKETETGYANGKTLNPTYEDVCYRFTEHAETVKVTFDEAAMPLTELLHYYFMIIDPFAVNYQGVDCGPQYRTGIYYDDPALLPAIREVIQEQTEKAGRPLAVEVKPLSNYSAAEPHHQKYLDKVPYGYCHIRPSLLNLVGGEK